MMCFFCNVFLLFSRQNKAPTTAAKTALEESFVKRLGSKCTQKDNSSCVMLKLVTYMNRLLKKSSIALGESVELTQTRYGFEFQS